MSVSKHATLLSNNEIEEILKKQEDLLLEGPKGLVENILETTANYDAAYYIKRIVFDAIGSNYPYAKNIDDIDDETYKKEIYKIVDENYVFGEGIYISSDFNKTRTGKQALINKDEIRRDIRQVILKNEKRPFTRKKAIVIALALNLDYNQTMELVMKACHEKGINYKNPYEVILMYCFKNHTNIYNEYTRLRELYESRIDETVIDYDSSTRDFMFEFNDGIDNEEKLMNFVLKLPNTVSTSAQRVFTDGANSLMAFLRNEEKHSLIGTTMWDNIHSVDDVSSFMKIFIELKEDDFEKAFEHLYETNRESVKKHTDNSLVSELYGTASIEVGKITYKFLASCALTAQEFREMVAGAREIRRCDIITLYFYKYVREGRLEKILDYFGYKTDSDQNDKNRYRRIYDNFRAYVNDALSSSGFGDYYLPNTYESFIMRCILTDDPIDTYYRTINIEGKK